MMRGQGDRNYESLGCTLGLKMKNSETAASQIVMCTEIS